MQHFCLIVYLLLTKCEILIVELRHIVNCYCDCKNGNSIGHQKLHYAVNYQTKHKINILLYIVPILVNAFFILSIVYQLKK